MDEIRFFCFLSKEEKFWAAGFTSELFTVARIFCSSFRFLEMIMAMWTGSSWNRSWRDNHSKLNHQHLKLKRHITQIKTVCSLTCRFLLILRMLCCSRKLFSRAKRLCWSSSWARRSWNRTVARESCTATVSLRKDIATFSTEKKLRKRSNVLFCQNKSLTPKCIIFYIKYI